MNYAAAVVVNGPGLASAIGSVVLALGFVFAPLFAFAGMLSWQKQRNKARAFEPFRELPLRPAGESLRVKIDELTEHFEEHLFLLWAVSMCIALALVLSPGKGMHYAGAGLFLIVCYGYFGPRLVRSAHALWDYRLGYTGERIVGEELNQLLAGGFRVFHDVTFDGFNVDHVIVGAPGVYVVETKTRRKPANVKGVERATVVFDGTSLRFPNGRTTEPLEQARCNARTISEWLTKAVGERVTASPIVTLPGWWIDRRARGPVNVLNPVEIKHSFPTHPPYPLTPEQIQRIAHQLTERCRMPKA